VADPGQRLVAAAISRGIQVLPVPGPSAILAALTVCGLPADEFVFAGFAPSRSNDRNKWLQSFADEQRPIVFFEAPHRIQKTLSELPAILGERPITVARELTKLHEEVIRTSSTALKDIQIMERGEFTVVIGPKLASGVTSQTIEDSDVSKYFYHLTNNDGLERRPAIKRTADYFGLSTKSVFSALERLKNAGPP